MLAIVHCRGLNNAKRHVTNAGKIYQGSDLGLAHLATLLSFPFPKTINVDDLV